MFWLGTIVSTCYIPGWTGASIPTQWCVLSIILPWALYRSGPITPFHLLGLVFVVFATLGLLWMPDTYRGIYGLWFIYCWALSLWLGTTLDSLHDLFAGLAIGFAASSAIGIVQALGAQPFPVNGYDSLAAGLFFNPVAQGEILVLGAVCLLCYSEWVAALCLLPGIILSGSRGAWLAFAITLAGFRFRSLWIFALVGAFGAFMFAIPHSLSDQTRLFIWTQASHLLTLWGHGPGSFALLSGVFNNEPIYPEHAHNDTLELVFEYGLFATIPLALLVALLAKVKDPHWPIILCSVVMGLYSFPLYMALTSFITWVVAGHMLRRWALDGDLWHLGRSNLLQRIDLQTPIMDEPRSQALSLVSRT